MLRTARDKAASRTTADGVGNTHVSSYSPGWINKKLWLSLIEHWNKPERKNLSAVNKANTKKRSGGSHTTGSGGFLAATKRLEDYLGRPPKAHEAFINNHVKKGTNPFVSNPSGSTKPPPEYVDEKSRLFAEKVEGLLIEKHGTNESDYPNYDEDIWEKCTGGKKKGRFYGSGDSKEPCYVLTGTPSSLSTCTSYATQQQPQVQILTQSLEEMQERHETTKGD